MHAGRIKQRVGKSIIYLLSACQNCTGPRYITIVTEIKHRHTSSLRLDDINISSVATNNYVGTSERRNRCNFVLSLCKLLYNSLKYLIYVLNTIIYFQCCYR